MKKTILKYALQNAVKYGGKANQGAVIGKILAENPKARSKEFFKEVAEVVNEVNLMSSNEQLEEFKKLNIVAKEKKEKVGLKKLENVKNKIIMRIAPFPSGPLHIGNARTAILNDEYVKMYKGKLILVIDDTIGSENKPIIKEAYKLIPDGLKWLGIKFDKKIIYKSDRLEIYYKYAKELIKKNKAYVCSCNAEILRANRKNKIECKCRSQNIKENLEKWKLMFKSKPGSLSLRIKTDMEHPNPAFRDRVLFRISDRAHPKVKNKYRVWPILEFSWAIDDHLLKITHIIRGKELMIESDMEKYIWDIFGWKHPSIIHSGLLRLEGVKISKSKSAKEVLSGKYKGWDDPRTWSLQSLEKRGIQPEALRKFLLKFGVNPTEITAPVDDLYNENKKLIDKTSNRYFFIENPKKIKIKNAPKLTVKVPLHPDFKKRGSRIFKTSDEFYIQDRLEKNKVYRFMHLFNFKNNEFINKDLDNKLNAKLIHWLPASKDLVKVEVLMDDGTVKKGLGESSLKSVKLGEVVQLERFAFCKVDKKEKDKILFWFTHR